jgi:metal-responsive CopG/Arc/MetJ family transcriptional regulator
MSKMPVNVELPEGIWKIIDNNFKLNGESDSEILSKIIKNHLAQTEWILSRC